MREIHRGKGLGTLVAVALAMLFSCTTSVCDCLPNLSIGAVSGDVLTSQQQPAAGAVVTFFAAADAVCDVNNREPLLTSPGFQPQVLTDQAGVFETALAGIVTGPRCVWVVAKADGSATDSTMVTVVTEFFLSATPSDTASVTLTLPAP